MRRFRSWETGVLGAMGIGLVLFVGLAFASAARPPAVTGGEGASAPAAAAQCRDGEQRTRRPCA